MLLPPYDSEQDGDVYGEQDSEDDVYGEQDVNKMVKKVQSQSNEWKERVVNKKRRIYKKRFGKQKEVPATSSLTDRIETDFRPELLAQNLSLR